MTFRHIYYDHAGEEEGKEQLSVSIKQTNSLNDRYRETVNNWIRG